MKRRNLSGIYIFDQFEGEIRRSPTAFEDCQETTQDAWLNGLDREALINLSKQLGKTIKRIADQFDLTT